MSNPNKIGKVELRGTLTENAPLGVQSWFGCGGTADLLFEPADMQDLEEFLNNYDGVMTILGGMANTIIRDGGVRGCVVRLGKPFAAVDIMDDHFIRAGAGALNGTVAAAAAKAGISGLEFLSGIPGTVGGALAMNAGAYGAEVKDVLVGVEGLDRQGEPRRFTVEELNMSYRHTTVPHGVIFTHAVFKGVEEDQALVRERLKDIKRARNETQPITEKTGGSTFANPSAQELAAAGLPEGTRAWQVVDMVGGRGFSIGGAQMSEKHCNFMINTGSATASDLEALGEEMRRRAKAEFELDLHWEIKRIGERA